MTISSENRKAGPYTGNGVTASFPFSFKVFAASDLLVVRTDLSSVDTTLTLTTDYTVSLNADQNANPGGMVTLTAGALTSGYRVTIGSQIAYTQATDLTNQGGFYPSVITNALDKLTILIQQLKESVGRTLKVSISTPAGVSTSLPPPAASKVIGWSGDALSLQNYDASVFASSVQFSNWQYDTFTGDGVKTTFTLSGNPVLAANMDVSLHGVTQVPGTDFTVSGTALTFAVAPPNGVKILARYGLAAQQAAIGQTVETQTATAGQTVFTVSTAYIMGTNALAVFMNGARLTPMEDYTETSTTSITLTSGATVGDRLLFAIGASSNTATVLASAVSYTPAGTGAVPTDVQTKLRRMPDSVDNGGVATLTGDNQAAIANAGAAAQAAGVQFNTSFVPRQVYYDYGLSAGQLASVANSFYGNADTIIGNIQLPVSTSTVTAGTGSKSFTFPAGLLLAAGSVIYIHENASGAYLFGSVTSYNNATGALVANITAAQPTINGNTYSSWYMSVQGYTRMLFQYGGQLKGSCQGDYVQVASSDNGSRPFNAAVAWYGGNGTIPILFACGGGAIGFGTETPSQRMHVVGATGSAFGAVDTGFRVTLDLLHNRGIALLPDVLANNKNVLVSHDWTGGTDMPLEYQATAHNFVNGPLYAKQGFGASAPKNLGATGTYTVAASDYRIINASAAGSTTVTLPTGAQWIGRELTFTNLVAQAVSASASIVVSITGVTGTTILPATAGKYVTMSYDGSNWYIVAAN